MYSEVSDTEKEKKREEISSFLMGEYYNKKERKVISIIDCFVHDDKIETNLISSIEKLKNIGNDVFLISNTPVSKEILAKVDFFMYDKRNQLFKKEYPGVRDVRFWSDRGHFISYHIKSGLQKHGLSVLINLFNAIKTCKELGYTHFQRFETDDLFGPRSMEWIRSIPDMIEENQLKGLFYLNPTNDPPDASFHYFYCDIDYFCEVFPRISCEEDYEKYLIDIQGNRDFRIVETFIYDNLIKNNQKNILMIREGDIQMKNDFPDTTWNTVVSNSNLPEKYRGCLTEIYKVFGADGNQKGLCVYSQNYVDDNRLRKIAVFHDSGSYQIDHQMSGFDSWFLHGVGDNVWKIDVYENDELLYSHETKNTVSYIQEK
jgi:hypothetical protein